MSDAQERIEALLAEVYGGSGTKVLGARIAALIEDFRARHPQRESPAPWSAGDAVLISYGDSLQSPGELPLRTLHRFLRERVGDAISTLHILPFFPFSSDDGFAVTDFRSVREALGDWPDIDALAADYPLAFDLVLNHYSREGLWFTDYVNDRPPGRDFFIEADPSDNLGQVVRPRSSPLLSGVRTPRGMRHVWTTFSNDQVDLDYSNPDVLLEFVDILLDYVGHGARILRLDAVAFLWKEIGTSCIHLPQTHAIVKLLRAVVDEAAPGTLILTETNVPNAENLSYFGGGDEAHLVYQFSLPPLLLHALWSGRARHLREWLTGLPAPPAGCSYLNFTASHDGVGLRPLEGLLPEETIEALLAAMRERGGYVSTRRSADGRDIPYELNITYFDACGPHDSRQVDRFLLSQTLPLALRGIPALYIHSLTATENDSTGVERTGMTRAINRRKWDLSELEQRLDDPECAAGRVLPEYLRRLRRRARQPALHPDAPQRVLDLPEPVLGVLRGGAEGSQRLTALHNLSEHAAAVALPPETGLAQSRSARDRLGERQLRIEQGRVRLRPYEVVWLEAG